MSLRFLLLSSVLSGTSVGHKESREPLCWCLKTSGSPVFAPPTTAVWGKCTPAAMQHMGGNQSLQILLHCLYKPKPRHLKASGKLLKLPNNFHPGGSFEASEWGLNREQQLSFTVLVCKVLVIEKEIFACWRALEGDVYTPRYFNEWNKVSLKY